MILVISNQGDDHATTVMDRFAHMGVSAVLMDTAAFPHQSAVEMRYEPGREAALTATINGTDHDLASTRTVWWRRPQPITLHDDITGPEDREFAFGECHAALTGLYSCLDAHWVNQPERDDIASRKAYQLKIADAVGLRTPRTLITNNPVSALEFVESEGDLGTIYKAFSATEHAWRETRLLRVDERSMLDAVKYAPVIFQEYVAADIDLRITIIGDDVFPAEILSGQTDYLVDYRMRMNETTVRSHTLPTDVVERLLQLMHALGIVYGAVDMRLTADGEYVFLEVNTAGQWLFIEQRTGQPITDAVANYLAGRHEPRG